MGHPGVQGRRGLDQDREETSGKRPSVGSEILIMQQGSDSARFTSAQEGPMRESARPVRCGRSPLAQAMGKRGRFDL